MPSYNGHLSRVAYLEALRQSYLEFAEAHETELGEEHPCVKESWQRAARLLEKIEEVNRA